MNRILQIHTVFEKNGTIFSVHVSFSSGRLDLTHLKFAVAEILREVFGWRLHSLSQVSESSCGGKIRAFSEILLLTVSYCSAFCPPYHRSNVVKPMFDKLVYAECWTCENCRSLNIWRDCSWWNKGCHSRGTSSNLNRFFLFVTFRSRKILLMLFSATKSVHNSQSPVNSGVIGIWSQPHQPLNLWAWYRLVVSNSSRTQT